MTPDVDVSASSVKPVVYFTLQSSYTKTKSQLDILLQIFLKCNKNAVLAVLSVN